MCALRLCQSDAEVCVVIKINCKQLNLTNDFDLSVQVSNLE